MSKLTELQDKLQKAKTNKQLPDALRKKLIEKYEKEIAALDTSKSADKFENFDISTLDAGEKTEYDRLIKQSTKKEALNILMANVDFDTTQMSKGLAKLTDGKKSEQTSEIKLNEAAFEAPYNVSDKDRKLVESLSQEQLDFFDKWRKTGKIDGKKVDNNFTVANMMRDIGPDGVGTNSFPAFYNYLNAVDKIEKKGSKAKGKRGPKPKAKYPAFYFVPDGRKPEKDDPIYYEVYKQDKGSAILVWGVIDEKLEHWLGKKPVSKNMSKAERDELYVEFFPSDVVQYIDEPKNEGDEKAKPVKKTYKGKALTDLDDKECDELLKEVEERRAAAKKSAKKSAKKPVIEKVSAPIVRGVEKAIKSIEKDDLTAKKVEQIKTAITATKQFIASLKTLLGEEYDAETVTEEIKPLLELAKKLEKQVEQKSE